MKIRIKYCGGCNPLIKRSQIIKEVLKLLQKDYFIEVVLNDSKADICLLICGCHSLCLDRDEYKINCKKYLLIGGDLVDFEHINKKYLVSYIINKIKEKMKY